MPQESQKLLQKAQVYAHRYRVTLDQPLGFGTHGTVFSVKANHEAGLLSAPDPARPLL